MDVKKKIYKDLDKIYLRIEEILSDYGKSTVLQNFFLSLMESLLYGNIINNFFINLTRNNVSEYKLPWGKIGKIKSKFRNVQRNAKLPLSFSLKKTKVDSHYYNNFKTKIKKEFPEFLIIISWIEKEINLNYGQNYLEKKEKEIRKIGKPDEDFNAFLLTRPLEIYIQQEKQFPTEVKWKKLLKIISKEVLPKFSKEVMKDLIKDRKEMLMGQRNDQNEFESQLYIKWEKPLDLLECLIRASMEAGEKHRDKLSKTTDITNKFKREAIIKIHARALQISNEILALLKAGYPDGANARWRSLHELTVICLFLRDNNNEVSKRYLEHEKIKMYKEARDYRACYKKLGYAPIDRKEYNWIKREHDKLIEKYGREFEYKVGFEWIPLTLLSDRNFRKLEECVNMEKWHAFYNLSCNPVHGGARGFYRLGLSHDYQDKILLIGSSSYGLADPLQNTAISLSLITMGLLNIEPDFESIIHMLIINSFKDEIGI